MAQRTDRPLRRRGYQRCSRIDYADGNSAFAVTMCVQPRRPVFTVAERNAELLREIRRLQDEGFWGVYVYCIMPDHFHVVASPGADGLSEAVRRLKGRYSAWWRENGDGHALWQPGFFDHRIRQEESFIDKCRYVLQNPVRAGLVERAEDYEWSGALTQR